jgi:hypothetical protein
VSAAFGASESSLAVCRQYGCFPFTAAKGSSPLGPYTYTPNSPMSYKPGGFINGAGHGSTVVQDKCTSGRVKKIGVSWYEDARRRARSLVETPEFLRSRRARSKVEALFSELKQRIGLSRLRLRRIRHVFRAVPAGCDRSKS